MTNELTDLTEEQLTELVAPLLALAEAVGLQLSAEEKAVIRTDFQRLFLDSQSGFWPADDL